MASLGRLRAGVPHERVVTEAHRPAAAPHAPRKICLLRVQEVALVEAADIAEGVRPYEQRRADRPRVPRGDVGVAGFDEPPRDPPLDGRRQKESPDELGGEGRKLVPARLWGPVGVHEPRTDEPGPGPRREHSTKFPNCSALDDGVVVEEEQVSNVAGQVGDSGVHVRAVAGTAVVEDDVSDALLQLRQVAVRCAGGIVDDDDGARRVDVPRHRPRTLEGGMRTVVGDDHGPYVRESCRRGGRFGHPI